MDAVVCPQTVEEECDSNENQGKLKSVSYEVHMSVVITIYA